LKINLFTSQQKTEDIMMTSGIIAEACYIGGGYCLACDLTRLLYSTGSCMQPPPSPGRLSDELKYPAKRIIAEPEHGCIGNTTTRHNLWLYHKWLSAFTLSLYKNILTESKPSHSELYKAL